MSERKIPDVGAVIQALRCTSTSDTPCRTDCPYLRHVTEEYVAQMAAYLGCKPGDIPIGELDSCNVDLIGQDAAELLVQMSQRLTRTKKAEMGGADNGL